MVDYHVRFQKVAVNKNNFIETKIMRTQKYLVILKAIFN